MQRLGNISNNYVCDNDIPFNKVTSQILFFDTRKTGFEVYVKLDDGILNTSKSYKYIEYRICDDLLDENYIKSKERRLYDKSNILHRTF